MKALKTPILSLLTIVILTSALGLFTNPYIQLIILFLFVNGITGPKKFIGPPAVLLMLI